jgi:PAS domain S-box-containing protein
MSQVKKTTFSKHSRKKGSEILTEPPQDPTPPIAQNSAMDLSTQKTAGQILTVLVTEARLNRQHLSAVMEALPVGIAILDEKGGDIQSNHTFEQIWGSPRPIVDGVNGYAAYKAWWVDTNQPIKPEEWASAQVIQKGKAVTDQLLKIQRFDGSFAYILNSAAPIVSEHGQLTGCVVAIQDVSDLKCREDEVRRLNRTLKALSNSNQVMLHATSEVEFLNTVCQIIVEDCGYSMVWIGYVEDDEQQSVKPVASAGFDQGYLDAMNISLKDPARSKGPTGTAIRTCKPARCNNMLTDPKFAPWRQAAIARGYASSIVIPLLDGDKAFGAINIYSSEPDGFPAEEEKLLRELASDLAFGIARLRLKAESARSTEALARSEEHYRSLFENMTEGFALHEIVYDKQGLPRDFRFLEINPAFERLTGLTHGQTVGRLASQVVPRFEPTWLEIFGKVTQTGQPAQFEEYIESLGCYLRVYAYRTAPDRFASILMDITEAKQATLQVNLTAEKNATLFNSTSDGVWIQDLEGTILEVNDAYCVMSGYSRRELTGMPVSALEANEKPAEITNHIQRLIDRGGHDRFETRHRRKDGTLFDVDLTVLYLKNEGGRIASFVRDISERKAAEVERERLLSEVQAERERISALVASMQDEVWFADPEKRFTLANPAAQKEFRLDKDEVVGVENLAANLEVLRPDGNPRPIDDAPPLRALKGEVVINEEEIVRTPLSGEVRHREVSAAPVRDKAGQIIGSVSVVRDITDRKAAEELIARSNRRISEILSSITDDFFVLDHDWKFVYANKQFAGRIGKEPEDFIGNCIWEMFPQHVRSSLYDNFHASMDKGETRRFEVKGQYTNAWYSMTCFPSTEGITVLGADISDRKKVEQALQRSRDELEQRVQERTQELASANDQLRAEVAERQKTQADLESSLQELQVIEEELRNNNEILLETQKVLEDEHKRYRDLFEFAPDAYLLTNDEGQILEANQYSSELLRISQQNLVGKPLIVFVAKADHPLFWKLITNEQHQPAMRSQELRLTPRRGDEIIASCRVTFAADQENKLVLRWSIRDITRRKRAEEDIQQNALRNAVLSEVSQLLADASLDEKAILEIVAHTTARLVGDCCIITRVSPDGNWMEPAAVGHKRKENLELMNSLSGTGNNPLSAGLFGRVYQSAKPLLIKELSPTDAQASVPSQYRQYLDAVGISSMLIVPIKIGDVIIGTLGILRDRGSAPYNKEDQSMLEDLAGRTGQAIRNARLYQELQAALRKELETHDQLVQAEKFAAVGRLLASITHEINNPLQTIKNCLYLSQADTQPGTAVYNALAIATTETNRLSDLVAQLREIYRPPTQGVSKPVSLPILVDEVQVLLASYLQDKHVIWEVTPPEDEAYTQMDVEGVPDQLKQVFLNVCLNAIDAMEQKGGRLSINFEVDLVAKQVGVCFRDTGPGLPEEVKSKLFEPFITTKEKGLGLGLTICYDIIQKHKGHIDVESEAGQGAAFTVWLPARS